VKDIFIQVLVKFLHYSNELKEKYEKELLDQQTKYEKQLLDQKYKYDNSVRLLESSLDQQMKIE